MEVKGFRHKEYEVYPAGQQPLNDDGSPGKWMALGRAGSWKISMSPGTSFVAVPKGSSVPVLRA